MAIKLFVGSLSHQATNQDLEDAFRQFGTVLSAQVIIDRDTRTSKGFGFVEMSDDNEARSAMKGLDGQAILGRPVVVNEARPREERPRKSFSDGRGRGFGGGGSRGNDRGGRY